MESETLEEIIIVSVFGARPSISIVQSYKVKCIQLMLPLTFNTREPSHLAAKTR